MICLIDENLPRCVGPIFEDKGFDVEYAHDSSELHGQPDEVLFDYAIKNQAIIVTRDVGLANLIQLPTDKLQGLILLRFPNEVSISTLCSEVARLIYNFQERDFYSLIIIEPGLVRKRLL